MNAAQWSFAVMIFLLVLAFVIAALWEHEASRLRAELDGAMKRLGEDRDALADAHEQVRAHVATIHMLLDVPFHERAGLTGGEA